MASHWFNNPARTLSILALALALTACASTPPPPAARPEIARPVEPDVFRLAPTSFADLPDWPAIDKSAALTAFKRSCTGRSLAALDAPLSSSARYGGSNRDWATACAAAETILPGQEQWFFETYFTPARVLGPGESRLTAYFEPILAARRWPSPGFTEPVLRRPDDMVSVDIAAFAEAFDDSALRGAPRRLTGQVKDGVVRPYPKRAEMGGVSAQAFAYAHPVDVYKLQIQGSGRLQFEDGSQARAAYAAQNGYRWNSALGALSRSGRLSGGATWDNFRAWSDANGPDATRAALNEDPSYVFFAEEPITDPSAGPRGAAGVPLTGMGSIAVDPAYHPYGAVIFVDGEYSGAPFRRLLVAQDTGGAIRRGPQRGDVFFGTGAAAGEAAERMNAPARWWTLLPRSVVS